MKSLLIFIFSTLKWAKFSKVFLSAGTILLSLGTYTMVYGWPYAVGFIGLIFVHEMGHYLAARSKQLNVGLPTFIPFVGAFIDLKDTPKTAEEEAYIAIAGPYVGSFAAFGCYFFGQYTHSPLLMALAQTGFIINLFNLIPLHPLDGGRITGIISPRIWFLGVPFLILLWINRPNPMLVIIALMALPQLIKAWNYDPNAPENRAYYNVSDTARIEYTILYIGLAAVLSLMIQEVNR